MAVGHVVFYGRAGLESAVFEQFMLHSGFSVHLAQNRHEAFREVETHPSAITVIAVDKPRDELTDIAHTIHLRAGNPQSPIFILDEEEGFELDEPGVQVVTRPQRLSNLVSEIRKFARERRDTLH